MAKEFLTDVKTLRARARKHTEMGAVTEGYRADRDTVVGSVRGTLRKLPERGQRAGVGLPWDAGSRTVNDASAITRSPITAWTRHGPGVSGPSRSISAHARRQPKGSDTGLERPGKLEDDEVDDVGEGSPRRALRHHRLEVAAERLPERGPEPAGALHVEGEGDGIRGDAGRDEQERAPEETASPPRHRASHPALEATIPGAGGSTRATSRRPARRGRRRGRRPRRPASPR
jgi:hypothetical protein